jgi:hypothetical protein
LIWSAEAALALVIVALYLKDCLLLLQPNEAVLVRARHWQAGFGQRQWTLAGREPYLAHPLLPHQPVFRLQWDMLVPPRGGTPPTNAVDAVESPGRLGALRRLLPGVWLSFLLLFVLIPTTVLGRWGVVATLTVLGLLYLNILVSLWVVWLSRHRLGLTGGTLGLLAFECLVCPPYAANLVRRLSWRYPAPGLAPEDFASAAARLLAPTAWAETRSACRARVQDQCDAEPEGTRRAQALQESLQAWSAAPAAPGSHRPE